MMLIAVVAMSDSLDDQLDEVPSWAESSLSAHSHNSRSQRAMVRGVR